MHFELRDKDKEYRLEITKTFCMACISPCTFPTAPWFGLNVRIEYDEEDSPQEVFDYILKGILSEKGAVGWLVSDDGLTRTPFAIHEGSNSAYFGYVKPDFLNYYT